MVSYCIKIPLLSEEVNIYKFICNESQTRRVRRPQAGARPRRRVARARCRLRHGRHGLWNLQHTTRQHTDNITIYENFMLRLQRGVLNNACRILSSINQLKIFSRKFHVTLKLCSHSSKFCVMLFFN